VFVPLLNFSGNHWLLIVFLGVKQQRQPKVASALISHRRGLDRPGAVHQDPSLTWVHIDYLVQNLLCLFRIFYEYSSK
jgi:hypothetical protein